MRIVCLSDTHNHHDRVLVPDGDLVVHCGDSTRRGTEKEIRRFAKWFAALPHRHKIVISGNHDFDFEHDPAGRTWITGATYLQDEGVEIPGGDGGAGIGIGGLKVWGSPWQPRFFDMAFNMDRGDLIRAIWDRIPADTDVLLTHGPPMGILDRTYRGEQVGCEELAAAVARVRPKLHVFGHIHESAGELVKDGVRYVNAAICDLRYQPVLPPIVVDL